VEIFGRAMAVPAIDIGVTNCAVRMIGRVQRLGGAASGACVVVDVAVMESILSVYTIDMVGTIRLVASQREEDE
jgi:hypothetical protein